MTRTVISSPTIARLLGLGDDVRVQNPKLQKSTGRNPFWYIRPYRESADGSIRKQERVRIGSCDRMTKRQAIQEKNKILDRINRRGMFLVSQIPFSELVDAYESTYLHAQGNLSYATAKRYTCDLNKHIRPTFGAMLCADITTRRVDDWLAGLAAAGLAHNTRRTLKNLLSGIFTKSRKWGLWKDVNPCQDAQCGRKREAREKRRLTVEQLRALLAGVEPELSMICKLALLTLRISEVLALQERHLEFSYPSVAATIRPSSIRPVAGSDRRSLVSQRLMLNGGQPGSSDAHSPDAGVNLANQGAPGMRVEPPLVSGIIHIRQRFYEGDVDAVKTAKSSRDVPMGILAAQLRAMCQGDPERFLFATWDYWRARNTLRAAAQRIGCYWPGFGFHTFRRMAKTGLSATGLDPFQVMRLAGHEGADMALLYTLADDEAQREAVETFQKKVLVQ